MKPCGPAFALHLSILGLVPIVLNRHLSTLDQAVSEGCRNILKIINDWSQLNMIYITIHCIYMTIVIAALAHVRNLPCHKLSDYTTSRHLANKFFEEYI